MNERAVRSSIHEGAHAATAHLLGWPVTGISRKVDGHGLTNTVPQTSGHIGERGIELAMILLAPLELNCDGIGDDLERVVELSNAGVRIHVAHARLDAMTATEEHRRLRWAITDEMLHTPVLDEQRVREILERTMLR